MSKPLIERKQDWKYSMTASFTLYVLKQSRYVSGVYKQMLLLECLFMLQHITHYYYYYSFVSLVIWQNSRLFFQIDFLMWRLWWNKGLLYPLWGVPLVLGGGFLSLSIIFFACHLDPLGGSSICVVWKGKRIGRGL